MYDKVGKKCVKACCCADCTNVKGIIDQDFEVLFPVIIPEMHANNV